MEDSKQKIAVIGAGIIGISSALRILQAWPHAEVTVYAEQTSPNTTSDVAAGFWGPSFLSDTPQERVISWSKATYDHLVQLARTDPKSASSGVFMCPGYKVFTVADPGPRYWSHIPIGYRMITADELSMFPSRYKSGHYYVTAVAEPTKLIPHLSAEFVSLGGKLIDNYRVESFTQISKLGYKYIVNCTGLGAMKLCNDQTMFPIRGQVHSAAAPWMKFWYSTDDGAYCLQQTTQVTLGGVGQQGNWNTSVSPADKAGILARNYDVWPQLREAAVIADMVGLRPGRPTVRLEREVVATNDRDKFTIYHNYGHGGSGLTLFWGCAGDIVDLLRNDFRLLSNEGTERRDSEDWEAVNGPEVELVASSCEVF